VQVKLPEPLELATVELAKRVGESALEALINALLSHRDPASAVEKATVMAASKQAYRRPDLGGGKVPGSGV
jgi:hypothetical protein